MLYFGTLWLGLLKMRSFLSSCIFMHFLPVFCIKNIFATFFSFLRGGLFLRHFRAACIVLRLSCLWLVLRFDGFIWLCLPCLCCPCVFYRGNMVLPFVGRFTALFVCACLLLAVLGRLPPFWAVFLRAVGIYSNI